MSTFGTPNLGYARVYETPTYQFRTHPFYINAYTNNTNTLLLILILIIIMMIMMMVIIIMIIIIITIIIN